MSISTLFPKGSQSYSKCHSLRLFEFIFFMWSKQRLTVKIGVGNVGVPTAEIFGGKSLTQAVLSGRGVFLRLLGKK
jgi:hypothetical protein